VLIVFYIKLAGLFVLRTSSQAGLQTGPALLYNIHFNYLPAIKFNYPAQLSREPHGNSFS